MNQFYSSLIINSKKFPGVHQVFKPRYNKEFFKRLTVNIEQLDVLIGKRCKNTKSTLINYNVNNLKDDLLELVKLKERVEKASINEPINENALSDMKSNLEALEERVMPFVIRIPNRFSKHVPDQETTLDHVSFEFIAQQNLAKLLSYTKLSYINNCYSKSVVGPNSHYYHGIGAKLQHSLTDFFTFELENQNFVPASGCCLAKSAVIEAANSSDIKDYTIDPCRVLLDKPNCTTVHVVEASRESLLSFITTIGPVISNAPLRLVTNGAGYRVGSDLFDSGDKSVSQFETVHALTLAPSIEQYSMKEYREVRNIIWNIYKKLELPIRLIQCSLDNMISNEYDASRIDVWLPSRHQWIQVARISHYLDYITVRVGMKRGHIIDSMVFDGQALVASIIENRQTSTGRFIIPSVIKEHISNLTEDERNSYFRGSSSQTSPSISSNVLQNYEQRRYLVKKNYVFSHSSKAFRENTIVRKRYKLIFVCGLAVLASMLDWEDVKIMFKSNRSGTDEMSFIESRKEYLGRFYTRIKQRSEK